MRSFLAPFLVVLCASHHVKYSVAFAPAHQGQSTKTIMSMQKNTPEMNNNSNMGRRKALFSFLAPITIIGTTNSAANAAGDDRLFKANPLMNPILEKIRILEQAEADNIQYGGELAPGSPKGRDTYAKLLIPILDMQTDFEKVRDLVYEKDGAGLDEAMKILNKPYFEKLIFKRTFNAFADNIYYSDPDRANAYLGGGAVPKNEQSIAYLLRNDILTNLENLQAEVAYLLKEMKAGNELETEDLYLYSNICKDGMVKYLELVPPIEIKIAKEIIASR
jgi:hypothetical protein